MDQPKSNLGFKIMSLTFKVRDFFSPRLKVLNEAQIQPGFSVLDYGCGPGGYLLPLAELIGDSGKIYALDIHPLSIKMIRKIASDNGLRNIKTIQSGSSTGLPDSTIDVALLYDVFHNLSAPNDILRELHRVLKPGGILSFSDHHMKESEILSKITKGDLFKLHAIGLKTYSFKKQG
jgi:ubiquinone/menaquinone biosynthesis C-methylase UbiE